VVETVQCFKYAMITKLRHRRRRLHHLSLNKYSQRSFSCCSWLYTSRTFAYFHHSYYSLVKVMLFIGISVYTTTSTTSKLQM